MNSFLLWVLLGDLDDREAMNCMDYEQLQRRDRFYQAVS